MARKNIEKGSKLFQAPVKILDINEILLAPYNPKTATKEEHKEIEKSLNYYGNVKAIVYNKRTGHVVDGNQRIIVMKSLGFKEVTACVIDVDIKEEMALNVALEKIGVDFDNNKLATVLNELKELDINLNLTGFNNNEIDEIFSCLPNQELEFKPNKNITEETNFSQAINKNTVNSSEINQEKVLKDNYITINFDSDKELRSFKKFFNLNKDDRVIDWEFLAEYIDLED